MVATAGLSASALKQARIPASCPFRPALFLLGHTLKHRLHYPIRGEVLGIFAAK